MIMGINGSKTLGKHMSCEYECKVDGRKFSSNQQWNNDECPRDCSQKSIICAKKTIFGILLHVFTKIVNMYEVLSTFQCVMKL